MILKAGGSARRSLNDKLGHLFKASKRKNKPQSAARVRDGCKVSQLSSLLCRPGCVIMYPPPQPKDVCCFKEKGRRVEMVGLGCCVGLPPKRGAPDSAPLRRRLLVSVPGCGECLCCSVWPPVRVGRTFRFIMCPAWIDSAYRVSGRVCNADFFP